jgi:hypothetical protein
VIDPGLYDWGDSGDSSQNPASYSNAPYSDSSGSAEPDYGADSGDPPENYYTQAPPASAMMPRQPVSASAAPVLPSPQEPLLVIFKDRRAPAKIQNYILSSTSLTNLDRDHHQQIPLDQIDIAATQQANRAHGLEFQIPGTSRD